METVNRILGELKQERSRLDTAIGALEKLDSPKVVNINSHRRGRPPLSAEVPHRRKRRHMSKEARARISEMMKLRWQERKAGHKKGVRRAA